MNKKNFLQKAKHFLDLLEQDLNNKNIKWPDHWPIDHLCYRSSSDENYNKLKENFKHLGPLLIESEVNGRMISSFKLNDPIVWNGWKIDTLELPAPKKGKTTLEGFEHIEIVCDVPFSALIKEFENNHYELDKKGLVKNFNKELELTLGLRNIKFHHAPLFWIVHLESHPQIWPAIKESLLLQHFIAQDVLIAGPYPLEKMTPLSPIVFVLNSKDLHEIQKQLKNNYGDQKNFNLNFTKNLTGENVLSCTFTLNNIPFHISATNQESCQQIIYKNFIASLYKE